MKKNERDVRRVLMERAAQIPPQYVMVKQGIALTGQELIDAHKKAGMKPVDNKGVEFVPDATYHSSQEVPMQVDHFKRMWRLLKKKGADAAYQYYKEALVLEGEAHQIKQIAGVPLLQE